MGYSVVITVFPEVSIASTIPLMFPFLASPGWESGVVAHLMRFPTRSPENTSPCLELPTLIATNSNQKQNLKAWTSASTFLDITTVMITIPQILSDVDCDVSTLSTSPCLTVTTIGQHRHYYSMAQMRKQRLDEVTELVRGRVRTPKPLLLNHNPPTAPVSPGS